MLTVKLVSENISHFEEIGGIYYNQPIHEIEKLIKTMQEKIPVSYSGWLAEYTEQILEPFANVNNNSAALESQIEEAIDGYLVCE